MLRAILGLCGASLIAFGVFGGEALESLHRGITGVFTPNTVVVEASSKPEGSVIQPELTNTIQVNSPQLDQPVAVALSENAAVEPALVDQLEQPELQVAALTSVEDVSAVSVNALSELSAKAVAATQAPVDELLENSQGIAVKDDGVAMVINNTNGLPPSDTLFVLKDRVNMREGPSTEHAVVLQLEMGQELMEFKRDGKWVHVGAYGTSGKIGWVHGRLVGEQ